MPKISFADAINFAISRAMTKDKKMICYGLGVTDPKNIFGTTKNLEKKFGKERVFDVPTSENALTGISVGLALNGVRSVVSHQRLDFFLLAFDQLINSAAKVVLHVWVKNICPDHYKTDYRKRMGARANSFTEFTVSICAHTWA